MSRTRRLAAVLTAGLLGGVVLFGCATLPPQITDTVPTHLVLKNVPFVPQETHWCGPATLSMVLEYHGHTRTQQALAPLLVLPEREGTLQIELTAAARREGFLAFAQPMTLTTLLEDVAAGYPVIVLQNLRFSFWPLWHYAVVIGFDQTDKMIFLRSGDNALIEASFNTFMNTWDRADTWALVVSPTEKLPPSVTADSLLKASEALIASGHSWPALKAYRTALKRWPQNKNLWNARGNLAYQTAQWQEAQTAFASSLALDISQALVWNNYAYALQQTGCQGEATTALICAEKQAPGNPLVQSSREEIQGITPVTHIDCHATFITCEAAEHSSAEN